ncbi:hypothetical protein D3C76_569670 [compost metagenome]
MTFADFDAGRVGGDQGQADAELLLFAQQMVGVVGFEGQAQQGGDRAEGDVALFPVQAQADHFFALPLAFADDAGVGHGASVGAGQWAGEGEAGDFLASGQAWQVVVALFVGAVMQQQFGRAEGVGHHHRGGQVAAAGGQFHRHLGVGVGGEALAAVFLGDDQGEKAMLLDMCPGFGRQVQVLADLPVADHGAQCFGRAIDEGLFFFGQFRCRVGQQGAPVGAATEQFAVPPHGAGVDGFALSLRHGRQGALEPAKYRGGKHLASPLRERNQGDLQGQHHPDQGQQPAGGTAENAHQQHIGRHDAENLQGRQAPVREVRRADHQHHQPQQQHNRSSLEPRA